MKTQSASKISTASIWQCCMALRVPWTAQGCDTCMTASSLVTIHVAWGSWKCMSCIYWVTEHPSTSKRSSRAALHLIQYILAAMSPQFVCLRKHNASFEASPYQSIVRYITEIFARRNQTLRAHEPVCALHGERPSAYVCNFFAPTSCN